MSDLHPLYEQNPGNRWSFVELGLFAELRRRAVFLKQTQFTQDQHDRDEDFAWIVRPSGVVVSYRINDDARGELRISRLEPIDDAWERGVQKLLRHFCTRELVNGEPADDSRAETRTSGACFIRVLDHPNDGGKTASRFLELFPGEVAPGRARCHECFERDCKVTLIDWVKHVGTVGQLCVVHGGVRASEQRMAARLGSARQESLI